MQKVKVCMEIAWNVALPKQNCVLVQVARFLAIYTILYADKSSIQTCLFKLKEQQVFLHAQGILVTLLLFFGVGLLF